MMHQDAFVFVFDLSVVKNSKSFNKFQKMQWHALKGPKAQRLRVIVPQLRDSKEIVNYGLTAPKSSIFKVKLIEGSYL